ncbi:hypothetical protein ARMA_2249 [Ardenticatena maritima]|uniref:Uncharacterized protein n=1 Tax=Ardenticatena maritima TaxID=872965 RepID=A0A0M8KAU1_9CHLR|nr:sucrase/ferredoxin-like family protein [Ardenticatena maritima]GAP63826.1 hypothetical protein ARMA_2249 [Ardenticatena maritima]
MSSLTTQPIPEHLGSVKRYDRHFIVCTGVRHWAPKVEQGGGFLQALADATKPLEPHLGQKIRVTASDEPSEGDGYDVLVFPDGVRYLGLREEDIPTLIEDHLLGGRPSPRLAHRPVEVGYVLVCVHAERDERCGRAGPPLVDRFWEVLDREGLSDRYRVVASSHLGGHKFAGNIIVYPSGDWYGLVTPADVERIVREHLREGRIVAALWRGRIGMEQDEQRAFWFECCGGGA